MFFKKKISLLQKENIRLNCTAKEKDQVIKEIGKILCDSGYVDQSYVDGMLKREEIFATNIGNGIAIPHSVEEGKKHVKQSGLAVMIFPDGTQWNDDTVHVVIGIAGKGDEHLEILANIAENLSSEEEVKQLIASDVDYIYNTFTGEE